MSSKNIVCIDSPTYKDVIYKYIMTDQQLEEYNCITKDASLIDLKVLTQLNSKGLLNKRYKDNVINIKL